MKLFFTNWMSMHTNLFTAQSHWPKSEWADIRAYVDASEYNELKNRAEKLVKALEDPMNHWHHPTEDSGDFAACTACQALANWRGERSDR